MVVLVVVSTIRVNMILKASKILKLVQHVLRKMRICTFRYEVATPLFFFTIVHFS